MVEIALADRRRRRSDGDRMMIEVRYVDSMKRTDSMVNNKFH